MKRRDFLRTVTAGAAAGAVRGDFLRAAETRAGPGPNILWLSVEDMSCDLGCYGDRYAVTPNIDRLAAQGVRFTNVFTNAGVCAPSRSGIITGMYPTTIGTHHMRCKGVPPPEVRCFPEYLRAAGYYCTNNSKTDYQFDPPVTAWDESSGRAHWRGRAEGQPFFAVINRTTSHESQIRSRSKGLLGRIAQLGPQERQDPAKGALPPYYPDTPVVRRDWAQYYDVVTLVDKEVGGYLKELEEDGLADDTIVWFWSDHGRGLPRAKRWIYDSGIHVPMIIRVPEKFRRLAMPEDPDALGPGRVNDDLIAFIDLAPTVLSLAGVEVPGHMQGQPFLGRRKVSPRTYVFAARDRMDEAYDLIRAVRDKRYKYIRNYMPHVPYGQDIAYMNEMPTMKEMRRLNAAGKLAGPEQHYFRETKPIEELYDTLKDPHEIENLAGRPELAGVLARMREAHHRWARETGDIGLIPEAEFDEMKRPGGTWRKTAAPVFSATKSGEDLLVRITCPTPGASIAYRTGSRGGRSWSLYAQPLQLKPGEVLRAKACRLGYRDSDEVELSGRGDAAAPSSSETSGTPETHWRERLDRTDLLERLRAIKALDGQGAKAIPEYVAALGDPYGSVRYWGVVGLRNACKDPDAVGRAKEAVAKLLGDPTPIVRIAAAQAMCDWGEEGKGLPVLVESMGHKSDTVRLGAITAMNQIGEKARPALPRVKAALKDGYGYVGRVAQHIIRRLEGPSD